MSYGRGWPVPPLVQVVSGVGGVVTTADDMARWLAMEGGQGRIPGGGQLLSPALLAESQTPAPDAGTHAMGWDRSGPAVRPERIGKAGALTGWQAQHVIVTGSGLGVAVLLNSFTPARAAAGATADRPAGGGAAIRRRAAVAVTTPAPRWTLSPSIPPPRSCSRLARWSVWC